MMVIYECDNEVLICKMSHEEMLKKEYFEEGGRDYDKYDRSCIEGTIKITSCMNVDSDRII